jgi:hypothetical protein
MKDSDRFKLIHGPYRPPKVKRGDKLFCEIRGTVTVGGYSDSPIPWPRMKKGGNPCLILCGDLVEAVRVESNQGVAHHFGVSFGSVSTWRKALGVPVYNEGTHRVERDWAIQRNDNRLERARESSKTPAALAKMSAALKGRIIPPSTIEAVRAAAKRPRSKEWGRKISELWKKRGHKPPVENPWLPEEDALLGTARDRDVAHKIGRTLSAVQNRRHFHGVLGFVVPVKCKKIKKLRERLGLHRRELADRAGLSPTTI